jgi:hypothetical protein
LGKLGLGYDCEIARSENQSADHYNSEVRLFFFAGVAFVDSIKFHTIWQGVPNATLGEIDEYRSAPR